MYQIRQVGSRFIATAMDETLSAEGATRAEAIARLTESAYEDRICLQGQVKQLKAQVEELIIERQRFENVAFDLQKVIVKLNAR